MDQRHQEYIEYYRARLHKFEHNPLFPHSAAAERAMFEAISGAATLEEFGQRVRGESLHVQCAVALARDHAQAWADFYTGLEEKVRIQPHLEILRLLEQTHFTDVMALTGALNEIHARWLIPIGMDETLREEFWADWTQLESLEVWEQAEVPENWREERREWVAETRAEGAKLYREHTLVELRKTDPHYQPDWPAIWEQRHRRHIPLADQIVERRLEQHQRYVGVK